MLEQCRSWRLAICMVIAISVASLLPAVTMIVYSAPPLWLLSNILFGIVSCLIVVKTKNVKITILIALANLFLHFTNAAYFFSYMLQGSGFNARFFYHLRPDLLSAGIGEFLVFIVLLSCLAIFHVFIIFLLGKISDGTIISNKYAGVLIGIAVAALATYLPLWESFKYIHNLIYAQSADKEFTSVYQALLDNPRLINVPASDKKNIVMLYMESVEQSFYDTTHYPNLLPKLKRLRDQSVSFDHIAQVDSASWTIAGIFASQCARPLYSPFSRSGNGFAVDERFASGAYCLGDILKEQGYHLSYMGGASTRFAGKGAFLKAHGYSSIRGKEQLFPELPDKKYIHGWGLYDDTLYDLAIKEFFRLSEEDEPFALTLLTLDTHHPTGHVSKACEKLAEMEKQITMLNALRCADQLADNFIRTIRNSPYSDNTIIVVMSDHLAMRNSLWEKISRYPKIRNNIFFVNYPDARRMTIDNAGTQYDIAPTILDSIGYELENNGFGWGRSLLRGEGFLSQHKVDINLGSTSSARRYVLELWNKKYGNINNGISIGRNGNKIKIGEKVFSLLSDGWGENASSMLTIDPRSGEIQSMEIWSYGGNLDKNTLSRKMIQQPDKLYFVITSEEHIKGLLPLNLKAASGKRVYFFGSPSSFKKHAGKIPKAPWAHLNRDQIEEVRVAALNPNNDVLRFHQNQILGPAGVWRKIKEEYLSDQMPNFPKFSITSCSFDHCQSTLTYKNKEWILQRGISIFGIDSNNRLKELVHIDGCAGQAFDNKDSLAGEMANHNRFSHFIAVSHDTAACHSQLGQMRKWAENSGFSNIQALLFRNPYIAIYSRKLNETIEYTAADENKITLDYDGKKFISNMD